MIIPILYAQIADITNTFNDPPGNQVRKIVFQFNFDGGGTNGQPTLNGYQARQNGTFLTTTPAITLSKSVSSVDLNYPLHLGNIEFTRQEFESIINDPKIPVQLYLVFTPIKSAVYLNSVTYKTSWSTIVPTSVTVVADLIGNELKPSPPAPPYN